MFQLLAHALVHQVMAGLRQSPAHILSSEDEDEGVARRQLGEARDAEGDVEFGVQPWLDGIKHASSSGTQSQQQTKWIFDDDDACRTMMARGDHSLAAASVAER